ncbi:MAG: hypothetical protein IK066_07055 [Kiritimatiellae bacterium]|nr:hypothetical protein [Kiritimatiellia bacterium]
MTPPIPLGFCLVRQGRADLPPACPPSYVAIAGCLCPAAIPFPDNIPLYGTDFRPEPLAAKWDITPETATALFRFNEAQVMEIDYASLTYRSLETARLALSTFFPDRPDVLLIALGAVDDAFLRYPGIQDVSPFPPDARLLGFDLYEFGDSVPEGTPLPPLDFPAISTMGLGCPLFCCDPDAEIPVRLGISLNSCGLYPDASSALAAASLVNRDHLAEPTRYLPFALYQC